MSAVDRTKPLAVAAVELGESAHENRQSMPVEPEPLRRPMPPAAEYPMDALGDVLGGAAEVLHEHVQAPAAMCGTSVLAAASLAAQGVADVEIDGRREPLTLWAVTIGESGERKSGVDELALFAHRQHERQALTGYQAEREDHDVEEAAYNAALQRARGGKGSRDAIRAAIEDVGPPPVPPLKPIVVMGEPTLEGVQKQLISGWPSIGLCSDDAGEFLGGWSMSKDSRTRTAASLSRLWDCGSFDRVRAGDDGAGKFYGKRAAMHLMVQPVIAETVLSDDVLAGQGFLPRCLLAWPKSTIGRRQYVSGDPTQSPELRRFWQSMDKLLSSEWPLVGGTRNELDPPVLTLTGDARAFWIRVYNSIEEEQAERGAYAEVRAWASKAASQVLRIAGVLTLAKNPTARQIQVDEIRAAASLASWHLDEAQ